MEIYYYYYWFLFSNHMILLVGFDGIFIQFSKILYLTYGLLVFGLDYHSRLWNIYSIPQDIIFNLRIIGVWIGLSFTFMEYLINSSRYYI